MNNPTFLALFSLVFILLGTYNVFSGLKRMREARARGISLAWYKQINILTGVEYILLALVFILSSSIRNGSIPKTLGGMVLSFARASLMPAPFVLSLVLPLQTVRVTVRAPSPNKLEMKRTQGCEQLTWNVAASVVGMLPPPAVVEQEKPRISY